jgi:phosphate-selective porin OprO/OprP
MGRQLDQKLRIALLSLFMGAVCWLPTQAQVHPPDSNDFSPLASSSNPYLSGQQVDQLIEANSTDAEPKNKWEPPASESPERDQSEGNAELGEDDFGEEELEMDESLEESIKMEVEFGEGFALVSEDEEFELRFHILNQVDYKLFSPEGQEPSAVDGVYIPRMRVYFEGKLTDPFRYEVSLQRSVEGQFDLLDANLDIRFSEGFQIRLGRTLIPYSYTWYDHLEQDFIVPERPLFSLNYGLSRAAGIQIWGEDLQRRWQYSVGIYDGRAAGLADDSTTTDGVGYVNFRPFVDQRPGGIFENLNLGGSLVVGKSRRPAELLPGRTSVQSSENDEAAKAASAVFLEFNPDVVGFGDRTIGALHVANYRGPLSLEAEWNALKIDLLDEATEESSKITANGFHVTLASLITGEQVRGRETVEPLRPFDPRCGLRQLGAIEPFARYSYLAIGDNVFSNDLVDEANFTNRVSMSDIGFNWYLNRYTKFYFNWQHAGYDSPVLVNESTGRRTRYNDLFWVRCQLYF